MKRKTKEALKAGALGALTVTVLLGLALIISGFACMIADLIVAMLNIAMWAM